MILGLGDMDIHQQITEAYVSTPDEVELKLLKLNLKVSRRLNLTLLLSELSASHLQMSFERCPSLKSSFHQLLLFVWTETSPSPP